MNVAWAEAVLANPQAGGRRGEIASVVASARDAKGLGEAAWTTGELGKMARDGEWDSSGACHFFDAEERIEGAEKNGTCFAFALTGHVQAVVVTVDKINVGIAGRSEQNGVAGCVAGGGVGGGIVLSEVGLDLDDAGHPTQLPVVTDQNLSEQFAGHAPRIASKEFATELTNRSFPRFACGLLHVSEILNQSKVGGDAPLIQFGF